MDLKVNVVYRDNDMNVVSEREYNLDEYVSVLRFDLLRIIGDVENAFYEIQGEDKTKWSKEAQRNFSLIRHKLLDKAGDIQRLPQNIKPGRANMKNGNIGTLVDDIFGGVKHV